MDKPPSRARENFVTFLLIVVLGGVFLFFLNLISFGIVFHVISALVGLLLVGMVHYALWGHALSEEVAGEREAEETRRRLEDDPGY